MHAKGDSKIMLIEKDEFLRTNKKVVDVLNSYFDSVTDFLDLFSWSTLTDTENTDALQNIFKSFHNHPSLIKIKQLVNNQAKFSFQPVSVHTVKEVIEGLPSNKATAEEINKYINKVFPFGKFLDSLKLSNIVPVLKKKDPQKEKLYDQLYMNNSLNELLCGFCEARSTQYALFKLLRAWLKEPDNSEFIGTIFMDLSKAYDCLPHDLLIAKLRACGLDRSSLRLLMDYLYSDK